MTEDERSMLLMLSQNRLEDIAAANLSQEHTHSAADRVLCDLLRSLGAGNVVDSYEAIDKRY